MTKKSKKYNPTDRVSLCEIYSKTDYLSEETILNVLNKYQSIDKYVYILHDKDIYTSDDIKNFSISEEKLGKLKDAHWHIYIHLTSARTLKDIAKWFNLEWNYVRPPRDGSKSEQFINMVAYAVHACKPNKYQYDISEVKSKNVDVKDIIEKYYELNAQREATKLSNNQEKKTIKLQEKKKLDEILLRIAQGEIRKFNKHNYFDVSFYSKYQRQINSAFEYRRDAISKVDRNIEVYYFHGTSQSGKSTYAKLWAKSKGYSISPSSSSNDILQDYGGEDVLFLDEFRAENMTMSDILKMLDNHTNSSIKSRYFNKTIEAKVIIITSIHPLEELYKLIPNHETEPFLQLQRRCKNIGHFTKDTIMFKIFDEVSGKYINLDVIENPVKEMYKPKPIEDIEKDVLIKKFLLE